jgi:archaea-specific DNA-binding protein
MDEYAEEQIMERSPDNMVFVGRKPTMNYVLAVVTQFNSGMTEVTLKARGKAISKAVDVKEIVKNRFIPSMRDKAITTSTEDLMNEDGTRSKVSAIQIVMIK